MADAILPPFGGASKLFIENKYLRWYMAIVSAPDSEGYTEKHHKIPRCLGGNNRKPNIVRLSARKHFLAHWLLTKFTEGQTRRKMLIALGFMTGQPRRRLTAWQYEKTRLARSEALRGQPSPWKGGKHTPEARAKMSAANKGKISPLRGREASPQARLKMSAAHKGKPSHKKGKPLTNEATRAKLRIARAGRTVSDVTRAKLSATKMGNRSKSGLVDSEETIAKKRLAAQRAQVDGPKYSVGLQGVTQDRPNQYKSRFRVDGKLKHIGCFSCPAAAHFAYLIARDSIAP